MKLILSFACENAAARPDGRLDVSGLFNQLSAPGFPAAQDRMMVVFVMQWSEGEAGRQEFRADLTDPDGRKVLTIEGHTDVEGRPASGVPPETRLVMTLERVVFPRAGEYRFLLHAAGTDHRAFSIFLNEASPD